MCRELIYLIFALAVSLVGVAPAYGDDIIWDFEDGNDHGFALWSVNPATPAADDPATAGDEALTGIGGSKGLPDAGVAWSIGWPDQFDGQKPAVSEGDKAKADGTMEYNQSGKNHPFTFPVNSRDQESYLNTYNLTGWGDDLHSEDNDQIATSPFLLIGPDAQLTVWVHGGGNGTHAPELDSNPNDGYTTNSAGVAVLSAADGSLLDSVLTNGHGTLRADTIDLSEFAGQIVCIEVVDAFQGAWGWIAVDEIRITNAIELSGAEPYPKAWGPGPADGTMIEDTWATLSWTAGGFANSHDVYLGDNFEDVNDATDESETFRGNQTLEFYVAGFPGYAYPEGLIPGTTYYWRIDEVNDAEPNSPWKGDIWSLLIPPKTAYSPNPADGAELVDLDVQLIWTAGFGTKVHYIVFGEDFDEVNDAVAGTPNGSTDYNPGHLTLAKTYYWRVDEFDGIETYKGEVWSFTTLGAVSGPNPADGAVDIKPSVVLSWDAAVLAASHEVYFGTDAEVVKNATKASPEYKAAKTLDDESYDPGQLALETAYYWRIDEINNTNPDSPWKGNVWSFTTGDFFVVDNFEDYDIGNNEIWWAWKDGLGYIAHDNEPAYPGNGTGSAIGDETTASYTEETIVHGSNHSMPFIYDNNKQGYANYSEAEFTLTVQRDWTQEEISVLSLWFYGNPSNAPERMYIAIANSTGTPAVVVHDDPAAATIDDWTEWVIPLQAFADQGIVLNNVDRIAIGFGTQGNMSTPGGSGKMF
ncbi:MAG TPA: hypothetical protein DIU00_10255, partial [Phycisphaerales bacterium]|nr:hypothetical protein [Phycisphaerales bacterium]